MTVPSVEPYVAGRPAGRTSALPWYRDWHVVGEPVGFVVDEYGEAEQVSELLRVLPYDTYVRPAEVIAFGHLAQAMQMTLTVSWMQMDHSDDFGMEVPIQHHETGMLVMVVTDEWLMLTPPRESVVDDFLVKIPTQCVTAIRLDVFTSEPTPEDVDWS